MKRHAWFAIVPSAAAAPVQVLPSGKFQFAFSQIENCQMLTWREFLEPNGAPVRELDGVPVGVRFGR